MCMQVWECVYMCMYVYTHINVCVCVYIFVHMGVYTCIYVYVSLCVFVVYYSDADLIAQSEPVTEDPDLIWISVR